VKDADGRYGILSHDSIPFGGAIETQPVVLDIPKDIVRELEQIAARRQLSVSQLMTEALEVIVQHEVQHEDEYKARYEAAKRRQLALLDKGLDLGTGGRSPASRDELHERQ
jgi:hypothetical protein